MHPGFARRRPRDSDLDNFPVPNIRLIAAHINRPRLTLGGIDDLHLSTTLITSASASSFSFSFSLASVLQVLKGKYLVAIGMRANTLLGTYLELFLS